MYVCVCGRAMPSWNSAQNETEIRHHIDGGPSHLSYFVIFNVLKGSLTLLLRENAGMVPKRSADVKICVPHSKAQKQEGLQTFSAMESHDGFR